MYSTQDKLFPFHTPFETKFLFFHTPFETKFLLCTPQKTVHGQFENIPPQHQQEQQRFPLPGLSAAPQIKIVPPFLRSFFVRCLITCLDNVPVLSLLLLHSGGVH